MTDKRASELSRRQLLTLVMQVSAVATASMAAGCAKNATSAACYDADEATESDVQLRSTLNYTDASPDSQQVCGGCAFFQPAKEGGGCGTCTLLKGAVSPGGHCTSWSARG